MKLLPAGAGTGAVAENGKPPPAGSRAGNDGGQGNIGQHDKRIPNGLVINIREIVIERRGGCGIVVKFTQMAIQVSRHHRFRPTQNTTRARRALNHLTSRRLTLLNSAWSVFNMSFWWCTLTRLRLGGWNRLVIAPQNTTSTWLNEDSKACCDIPNGAHDCPRT